MPFSAMFLLNTNLGLKYFINKSDLKLSEKNFKVFIF